MQACRSWPTTRATAPTRRACGHSCAGWVSSRPAGSLPVSVAADVRAPSHFTPHASALGTLDSPEIARALEQQEILLVDARAADRFAGENEKIDPVAGHIPGASNQPFAANLDAQGRFLAASALRDLAELTEGLLEPLRACRARVSTRARGANGFAIPPAASRADRSDMPRALYTARIFAIVRSIETVRLVAGPSE